MTARLRRPADAFLRSLQMSRSRLNIYIEGRKPDSYVYDKIAADVCASTWDYRIITPKELPAGYSGEGKACLVRWYTVLRRRRRLIETSFGKFSASLFVFDKDVDDMRRSRCRSDHVVYTTSYDIENHLFAGGDLAEALAAIMCIPKSVASDILGSQDQWRRETCELWRDWAVICATARVLMVPGYAGYRATSRVNPSPSTPADRSLVQAEIAAIKALLNGHPNYNRVESTLARFHSTYDKQEHEKIFKGKWFVRILEDQLKAGGHLGNVKAFPDRIISHLAQSADPKKEWANFLRFTLEYFFALTGLNATQGGKGRVPSSRTPEATVSS
ncbi:hypothetical protein [Micromonospora aurantiaca]|uniref:hypothetical protein n=1 Tax=Micromonospora aurantiaca (nom. illeg.) TaxID=47850 RepID=UPI0011CE90F1|nr:hypothetical protein [Micromonospora aurantiaca]